jgi:hypothetical protein
MVTIKYRIKIKNVIEHKIIKNLSKVKIFIDRTKKILIKV